MLGNFQNFKQFLAIFLLLPVSAANVRETVVEKFSYSELKIEKLKLLLKVQQKLFAVAFFNVEGCLASCLTFRPFLTLDP